MTILLINCSWNNRGDESAIRAMIDELRLAYPNIQFEVLCHKIPQNYPYPEDVVRFTNIPYFTRKNYIEIPLLLLSRGRCGLFPGTRTYIKRAQNADLVMHGPGGPSMGDIYRSTQFNSYFKFLIALALNKPYLFYAPSMGPFVNKFGNWLRRIIFNHAQDIATRDMISAEYMRTLRLKKPVRLTADSALQHPVDAEKYEKEYKNYPQLTDFMRRHDRVVGMTVTDLSWHPRHGQSPQMAENIRRSFSETVRWLTQRGFGVLFIPQLFAEQNDYDYMSTFLQENCFILDDQHDCYFQQHLISKLYAVIGLRYHSNIFSAKMGTPFLSVSYEQKMKGFAQSIGMEDYCIDINDLSAAELQKRFTLLEQNHAEIAQHLADIHRELQSKAYQNTQMVCDYIDKHQKSIQL